MLQHKSLLSFLFAVWMRHVLLIRSSVDRHLGFPVFGLVNNVSGARICMQVFMWAYVCIFLCMYLGVELPGNVVTVVSVLRDCGVFSSLAAPVAIEEGSSSSASFPTSPICLISAVPGGDAVLTVV